MRIGVDIDGVLTNIDSFVCDYFTKFCHDHNLDYKITEFNYSLAKTYNMSEEDDKAFWDEYLYFYATQFPVRPFASEVLKKLKDEGHEIYIITARHTTDKIGGDMQNLVLEWLKKNEITYDKIVFTKNKNQRKVDEIKQLKIDVMIEDNPSNINEISEIIPVICYNALYNQNCKGENIFRCYSWYEIYKLIKEKNF